MFTKALKEQSICITEVTWEVEKKFKFDFIFFLSYAYMWSRYMYY